jgi:hypothetical protein
MFWTGNGMASLDWPLSGMAIGWQCAYLAMSLPSGGLAMGWEEHGLDWTSA